MTSKGQGKLNYLRLYAILNIRLLPSNNLRALQEKRGGFVHSFTRMKTETGCWRGQSASGGSRPVYSHGTQCRFTQVTSGQLFGFGGAWHRLLWAAACAPFLSRGLPQGRRDCPHLTWLSSLAHHNTAATFNQRPWVSCTLACGPIWHKYEPFRS